MNDANDTWFLAFVITPAIVILLGYAAVRWHEYDIAKQERQNKSKSH